MILTTQLRTLGTESDHLELGIEEEVLDTKLYVFFIIQLQRVPNNSTNIQRYRAVTCTVEHLFAVQVGARMQNCHTLPLSPIHLLTTAVG